MLNIALDEKRINGKCNKKLYFQAIQKIGNKNMSWIICFGNVQQGVIWIAGIVEAIARKIVCIKICHWKILKALENNENPAENFTVVLTGGEPLLRKDIEQCGREIRKRGMRWSMVTNGFSYDEEKHISLLNAGMGALTISLDGLESSHNWLRNNQKSLKRVDKSYQFCSRRTTIEFWCSNLCKPKKFHRIGRNKKQYLIRKKEVSMALVYHCSNRTGKRKPGIISDW